MTDRCGLPERVGVWGAETSGWGSPAPLMRAKRTYRILATALALTTVIVGAAETDGGGDALIPSVPSMVAKGTAEKDIPEPSAILIGAVGLLLLLGRHRHHSHGGQGRR